MTPLSFIALVVVLVIGNWIWDFWCWMTDR